MPDPRRGARLDPGTLAVRRRLVWRVADDNHDRPVFLDPVGLTAGTGDRLVEHAEALVLDEGIIEGVCHECLQLVHGNRTEPQLGDLGEDPQLRDCEGAELDLKADDPRNAAPTAPETAPWP